MRKSTLFILVSLCLFSKDSFSQSSLQQQAKALLQTIKEKHFSPRTIDDNFSASLFDKTFEGLDPDKTLFTKIDLTGLSMYKTALDDELNGNTWAFLNKIIPIYRQRLLQADTMITEITSKPFDFLA